ncbi:hypothetical protein [Mucilaginibacter sp.]|uniref:hypothetical protein n=1 Tax=Mucilaginibacter sp. TaxID=1882438 RepID=UPI0026026956|nr:hypothetical protein [Mucilaginibacter sp.]
MVPLGFIHRRVLYERPCGDGKVFEPSFDAKPVYTLPFLHQKLDYIHHNPVNGKWSLCAEFTDYPHSSAAFYHDDKPHPFVTITDYRDFWG